MSEHPNVGRIKAGYAAFSTGDLTALNDLFAEDLLWHVGGRNQLAGEYRGRDTVYGLLGKVMEVTGGTFRIDVEPILADDTHATASGPGNRAELSRQAACLSITDGAR